MPELRVHRSPWGDFPDVIVQTTVNKLRSRAAYDKAKRGVGKQRLKLSKSCLNPKRFDLILILLYR
jgi:hypothetical protein